MSASERAETKQIISACLRGPDNICCLVLTPESSLPFSSELGERVIIGGFIWRQVARHRARQCGLSLLRTPRKDGTAAGSWGRLRAYRRTDRSSNGLCDAACLLSPPPPSMVRFPTPPLAESNCVRRYGAVHLHRYMCVCCAAMFGIPQKGGRG